MWNFLTRSSQEFKEGEQKNVCMKKNLLIFGDLPPNPFHPGYAPESRV